MQKLTSRTAFLGAALLALATPTLAQEGQGEPPPSAPAATPEEDSTNAPPAAGKASLAVMPFTFSALTVERADDVLRTVVKEFETSALTNKFITALVKTRKFDVVERSRVEKLLEEMDLTKAGITDPGRAVRAGRMVGADYFLMGEISFFRINTTWDKIPYTERWQRTVSAHMTVDMRIVDTRTSRVVSADTGEVRWERGVMYPSRFDHWETPADLIDTLHRELCQDLVIKTIDGVYPIKVIGVSRGVYSLNRGDGGGLAPGTILEVFSEGEALVDPDTGEVLGYEEVKLGTIEVSEILPRFSKAVHRSGPQPLPKGAICRRSNEAPAPPPEAPRARPPGW